MGLIGEPMTAPSICSQNLPVKNEVSILQAELQQTDHVFNCH